MSDQEKAAYEKILNWILKHPEGHVALAFWSGEF
jgi:hypothetical protein